MHEMITIQGTVGFYGVAHSNGNAFPYVYLSECEVDGKEYTSCAAAFHQPRQMDATVCLGWEARPLVAPVVQRFSRAQKDTRVQIQVRATAEQLGLGGGWGDDQIEITDIRILPSVLQPSAERDRTLGAEVTRRPEPSGRLRDIEPKLTSVGPAGDRIGGRCI